MKWAKDTCAFSLLPAKLVRALALIPLVNVACGQVEVRSADEFDNERIIVGSERTIEYVPLLQGKNVAIVTNQTGTVGAEHLVDTLLASGVNVAKVFAPEHGFRGQADAGEKVSDSKDARTGLPIVSLYGKNKKPTEAMLNGVEQVVFDIQDVGARFYTYISTLHYVMEACAEQGIPVMVLDRPDPNGFYVDGPILDLKHSSFVGMHPVPVVHGMTIGEYAMMINGEGWLKGGVRCELHVIECKGYTHDMFYELPVRPSPNLPNMTSVYLYPSLCFFEGTIVSVGRGTDKPFQVIGHPKFKEGAFLFTPEPNEGASSPRYLGEECRGFDLSSMGEFYIRDTKQLNLKWLLGMYEASAEKEAFFTSFFDTLAGGPLLREQIQQGMGEEAIRASWQQGLREFSEVRAKYLVYP